MRILITGGSGSLGHALVPVLLKDPAVHRVLVYSRDEVKQDLMREEFPDPKLDCLLGDVRDVERCKQAFRGCTHVIHAAALKRITHSVYSPSEMRQTNVNGTANVIRAAWAAGVKRLVVVSSDKACHPTNLYGASKFMAEQEAIQSNSYTYPAGTEILAVRYGNVWGSRGSVGPVWKAAIAAGEPVKVTDWRMTRFLMTLDEAAVWVLRAMLYGRAGEIWVPKLTAMGLETLWEVVGEPAYLLTGWRPGGEKLHEMLLNDEEIARVEEDDTGYRVIPSHCTWRTPDWMPTPQLGVQYRSDRVSTVSPERLRDLWASI